MGTFGPGPFENDFALEWLAESADVPSAEAWVAMLFAEIGDQRPLDADAASFAAVTAAVLLRCLNLYESTTLVAPPRALSGSLECLPRSTWRRLHALLCDILDSELSVLWRSADPAQAQCWRTEVAQLIRLTQALS